MVKIGPELRTTTSEQLIAPPLINPLPAVTHFALYIFFLPSTMAALNLSDETLRNLVQGPGDVEWRQVSCQATQMPHLVVATANNRPGMR